MGKPESSIRFCVNNPRTLAERNDLIAKDIECRDCLSNCTACFEGRFLVIDDEIVSGDSYGQILSSTEKNTGNIPPAE
jgi:uncharacterized protein YuzB (UPF0349 family)